MTRRLGNHRIRPALSAATRAKPQIAALEAQIASAKRRGDLDAAARYERERAWALINSLVP